MSKITFNLVLAILKIAIPALGKVVRLIATCIDLCDNGKLDHSAANPKWLDTLIQVFDALKENYDCLCDVDCDCDNDSCNA